MSVGHYTILEFLSKKGVELVNSPKSKLTLAQFAWLLKEYPTVSETPIKPNSEVGKSQIENEDVVSDETYDAADDFDGTENDKEAFHLMTDGNSGSYEDFVERGGTSDDLDNQAGRN